MQKYVCDLCGYIYDPAEGDTDNVLNPVQLFADLPEDWACPLWKRQPKMTSAQ